MKRPIFLAVLTALWSTNCWAVSIGDLFEAVAQQPGFAVSALSVEENSLQEERAAAALYPKLGLFGRLESYNSPTNLRPMPPTEVNVLAGDAIPFSREILRYVEPNVLHHREPTPERLVFTDEDVRRLGTAASGGRCSPATVSSRPPGSWSRRPPGRGSSATAGAGFPRARWSCRPRPASRRATRLGSTPSWRSTGRSAPPASPGACAAPGASSGTRRAGARDA